MKANAMTFSERELMDELTVTITVERSVSHRILMRFGIWVMGVGARIAGVGHVNVEDAR